MESARSNNVSANSRSPLARQGRQVRHGNRDTRIPVAECRNLNRERAFAGSATRRQIARRLEHQTQIAKLEVHPRERRT